MESSRINGEVRHAYVATCRGPLRLHAASRGTLILAAMLELLRQQASLMPKKNTTCALKKTENSTAHH